MRQPGSRPEGAMETHPPIEFVVAQYEQMHEMRREYNRFVFQAPTIVVAVAGGLLAVMATSRGFEGGLSLNGLRTTWGLLLAVGVFVLVVGYWALRSRLLLLGIERALEGLEARFGEGAQGVYPSRINQGLKRWQRGPSSLFIILYILLLGLLLSAAGIVGLLV